MLLRIFFLLLAAFLVSACNKPEPKPELHDQIYLDMQSELQIADKNIAEAQKQLAEHETNLKKVVPQTGQIKFAQKRVFDAQNVIATLEQQKKYWIIRSEERRNYVRKNSMKAFLKGEKWSDQSELDQYQAEKRLRAAKLHWDSRQRREDFLKEEGLTGKKPKAAEGGHH